MRSHSSSPASRAQDAPRLPNRAAPSPAHLAPRAAPRSIGPSGRRPVGPRRTRSVVPTPMAMPIRAAVRRSYCSSCAPRSASDRSSAAAPSESWPRGIVLGRRGVAVETIRSLLGLLLRSKPDFVDVLFRCRKDRPTVLASQGGRPGPDPPHCRRRAHECVLGFLLYHLKKSADVVQPLLGHRDCLLQSRIRRGDGGADLLNVGTKRGCDVVDVVG